MRIDLTPFIKYLVTILLFQLVVLPSYSQNPCIGEQGKLIWQHWNAVGSDSNYVYHLPNYPQSPDFTLEIDRFSTSVNGFRDNYRSSIQGFLTVPVTGDYIFNLTADDDTRFFLSTDDQPNNTAEIATVLEWTNMNEFDKYPEQTSASITLQENTFYYFKVTHREGGGGDHISVHWKTPIVSDTFLVIPGDHIYEYSCTSSCPKAGTNCDDNNSNTINDQEDGFCNCIGTPTSISSCIGERNSITAFYYKGLPNNQISDLEALANFPLMPDTLETLPFFNGPLDFDDDYYGTRISGYLQVPISGNYEFNISNDDRGQLKLSTDENPENANIIANSNWTPYFDHYDESTQSSGDINLTAGSFYFFEYLHVQGGGGDRYSVFWRTPYQQDTLWRFIDQTYLYSYNCEMACIPEGTPCNDKSDLTINDQYDDACNCIGTPCDLPDCRDYKSYTPTENCGVTDNHSTNPKDAWLSCQSSISPNPNRGNNHWIQYDLGQVYVLHETHIWNYNVLNETTKGFRGVTIDYSIDGINWHPIGNYIWDQALGDKSYTGFDGPNFNGIQARYILITATSNWGDATCSGFSKITFGASNCLNYQQPCDDGNEATTDDRFDLSCTCIGTPIPENNCGPEILVQHNLFVESGNYDAQTTISSKAIVDAEKQVNLVAGESVTLEPGFDARAGSSFLATILPCDNPTAREVITTHFDNFTEQVVIKKEKTQYRSQIENVTNSIDLHIMPNPTNNWTTLSFDIGDSTFTSMELFSTDGRKVFTLINNQYFEKGTYHKSFPAQRLAKGMYFIQLKTEQEMLTKPLIVIE